MSIEISSDNINDFLMYGKYNRLTAENVIDTVNAMWRQTELE